ncbi:fimbrial biogenesis chaperone [Microbulbifer hainanensis]|uniref:fimbrial biogenesis chaperone n=1 Tax=Microbulbifer hainanensis TaxID=2735675 RepID=UPI0018691C6C|nr:fimbria/pilus periplasmic chaperone [Microbulbifer hainanensis]
MKKIALACLVLLTQPALAAMSLDKIIVYLDDTPNARDDIVVSNPDAEPLYLQTEIFRVDNPGKPDEKRVRVVTPKDFKLLVSPSKAVLAPGEQKRFRLMSLERNLEQEVVYRVTFKPVVGKIKSDRTALKILVAYQALVFVEPQNGKYDLQLVKRDSGWALENRGNINADVSELQYCQSATDCRALGVKGRIYAGAALPIDETLSGGHLSLHARSNRDSRTVDIPVPGRS